MGHGTRHGGTAHVYHARQLGGGEAIGVLDEVVEAHDVRAAKAQAARLGVLDALDLLAQGADDAHEVLEAALLHGASPVAC